MTSGPTSDLPGGSSEATDDDAYRFTIDLPFGGVECEGCGEAGEEGACVHCGEPIPAPAEDHALVTARIAALSPLLREFEALEAALLAIRTGSTVVSADQLNSIVVDLDIYGLAASAIGFPRKVQDLEFDDTAEIGGHTRAAIARFVPEVQALVSAAKDLAWFEPEGPGLRLQNLTIAGSQWAAGTVRATLEALVAPSPYEARRATAVLQGFLEGSPAVQEAIVVLDEITAATRPDANSRLELVLGRPGPFTDEAGFIDFSLVFGAFSNEENPLGAIDAVARRYFADCLGDVEVTTGAAVILTLPMMGLASLDRPLTAHQILRGTVRTLESAWEENAAATLDCLRTTSEDAALVLGGLSRAQNGLRLLALAEEHGWVDEANALMQVMNAYRELAEAPFRTFAWTVYRLHHLSAAALENTPPPMLGELAERLDASQNNLLVQIGGCVNRKIRNAASHAQYRWLRETSEAEDLRTGQRWSLDELTAAVEDLVSAVLGLDAGLACFAAREHVSSELGEPPEFDALDGLLTTIIRALFAAQGYHVLTVADGMCEITLDVDEISLMKAIPVLGGIATLDGIAGPRLSLFGPAGEPLLSVEAAELRAAAAVDEEVRDLAIATLCRRLELNPRSDSEFAGLAIALVVLPALREASEGAVGPTYLTRLLRRLEYLYKLPEVGGSNALPTISQAISSIYQMRSGKQNMARSLVLRLTRLLEWAFAHDLRTFD